MDCWSPPDSKIVPIPPLSQIDIKIYAIAGGSCWSDVAEGPAGGWN